MTDIVGRLHNLAVHCTILEYDTLADGFQSAYEEIEHLRLSLSEARATGYREAYEVRMKKFRSGCACHMNDADEIVSMCQHHEALVAEARAIGRREGMEAMTDALNDDALTKRAADFLLERDQQTTQDERDEGEREASAFIILQMGAAAIRAAMEKEE